MPVELLDADSSSCAHYFKMNQPTRPGSPSIQRQSRSLNVSIVCLLQYVKLTGTCKRPTLEGP